MSESKQQIAKFVADVREALNHLPESVVAQLTDDLELELAERNQAGDSHTSLGSPTAFANELRESAGIAAPKNYRSFRSNLPTKLGRYALSFLRSIKPGWWVMRALVAYDIARWALGHDFHVLPDSDLGREWWLIGIFAFVSVQFGRGAWSLSRLRGVAVVANLVLALLTLPFLVATNQQLDNLYNAKSMIDSNQLIGNGYLVFSPKALDKNGALLPMAKLTDSDGAVIYTAFDETLPVFKPLIGLTKDAASKKLLAMGYRNVLFDYTLIVGVKKDIVFAVDESTDASGFSNVRLKVSTGATK